MAWLFYKIFCIRQFIGTNGSTFCSTLGHKKAALAPRTKCAQAWQNSATAPNTVVQSRKTANGVSSARNLVLLSSIILIMFGEIAAGMEEHNYKKVTQRAAEFSYTYDASERTVSDLAAGFTNTVIVQFHGCNAEDTCIATAYVALSPNTTIVFFGRKRSPIGFFLEDGGVGYWVKGPKGETLTAAVVPTEEGSVLLQIKRDVLGGALRVHEENR
jgi:hypothetical protein